MDGIKVLKERYGSVNKAEKEYIFIQRPFLDEYDFDCDKQCIAVTAICPDDVLDKDGFQPVYKIFWFTNQNLETIQDNSCDWSNPDEIILDTPDKYCVEKRYLYFASRSQQIKPGKTFVAEVLTADNQQVYVIMSESDIMEKCPNYGNKIFDIKMILSLREVQEDLYLHYEDSKTCTRYYNETMGVLLTLICYDTDDIFEQADRLSFLSELFLGDKVIAVSNYAYCSGYSANDPNFMYEPEPDDPDFIFDLDMDEPNFMDKTK